MPSEATLDFESLLAPISEESPSGQSLREHPDLSRNFYAVRESRNAAMEAERTLTRLALMDAADFEQDPSGRPDDTRQLPQWDKVVELASDLIGNHSKDLWIVGWLIEALTREAGIPGFRDALRLCREMSDQFWDTIHPRPDEEDGYGHTVAQLSGLDNALPTALEASVMIPQDARFTWTNYQLALSMEQLDPEERAARIEDGAVSLPAFESAARSTSREDLLRVREDLLEAIQECTKFTETLDRLCGKDDSGYPLGPSTTNLVRMLERLTHDFDELTSGLLEEPTTEAEQAEDVAMTETGGEGASLMQRPVASRDEALQHLLRVADFFRKTEPHSPVSYALEQAVRWGRLPLPDLLKDLVSDEHVLADVFKRMGIGDSDASSSESYD